MDMHDDDRNRLLPKKAPKTETSFTGGDSNPRRYGAFSSKLAEDDLDTSLSRGASSRGSSPDPVEDGGIFDHDDKDDDAPGEFYGSGFQDSGQECPPDLAPDTYHQPPALNCVGLSYEVVRKPGQWWNGSCFRRTERKQILRNLCMTFRAGELTALVGNSGSGKTSLLDIIAGRAKGRVNGVVSYKHETCTRDVMREKASYVLQADRLLPTLTVREALTFMAYLKLPGHYTPGQIEEKVQSVIMDMGLRNNADQRVGGSVVRGVSGGEKRRITIGIQLLKDPEILLLDEPTSGLDAFTARHLVSSLADLAHKGKLVLMSIHQPRSDIFGLLDKIAILTCGRVAFLGRPSQMVPYFSKIGFPCPRAQNPCDVYIDITSVDTRTPSREKETQATATKICNAFSNSDLQTNVVKEITSGLNFHFNDSLYVDQFGKRRNAGPSWLRVIRNLLVRMNVHLLRDRGAFLGRLLYMPFFIPFVIMFTGSLGSNEGSIQDRLGIIYQCAQVPPYIGLTNAINLFPVLRDVFYRECFDGLYSTPTFLMAYFIHILPFSILTGIFFSSGLYWIVGFQSDFWIFGQFNLMVVMLTQFGELLTVCMLGLFRDSQLANNTTALILTASGLVASGLIRSIENMPSVLRYAGFASVHKYAVEVIVSNEFSGLNFACTEGNTSQTCVSTGDEFLAQTFPDSKENLDRNWAVVCGYFLAIWLVAVVLFKIKGIPTLH